MHKRSLSISALRAPGLLAFLLLAVAPAAAFGAASRAGADQGAEPGNSTGRQAPGKIQDIVETGAEAQNFARASQKRIDKTVQETAELAAHYKNILKETEGLRSYNAQLERQLEKQRAEMADLRASADNVVQMERQMMPLMTRMVDALGQFIALDLPFHRQERQAGIVRLKAFLDRPDIVISEKFRAVMEAYETELGYGKVFASYDGKMSVEGKQQLVHFLQVGRIAFLFQTPDGQTSGLWNPTRKAWDLLDARFADAIAKGIHVAQGEAPAEELLPIPLRTPVKKAALQKTGQKTGQKAGKVTP